MTPDGRPSLAEFVRARLDEAEARAKTAATGDRWQASRHYHALWLLDFKPSGGDPAGLAEFREARIGITDCMSYEDPRFALICHDQAAFIAAFDPSWVLADVEAKRAILAAREDRQSWADDDDPDTGPSDPRWSKGAADGLRFAVQQIAAIDSGHADYRQEWAL